MCCNVWFRILSRCLHVLGNTIAVSARKVLLSESPVQIYNHLKAKRICVIQGICAYRAVNTLHLGYKNQSFNAVYGKTCCSFRDPYKTQQFLVITA
jgi:hypothetical protein